MPGTDYAALFGLADQLDRQAALVRHRGRRLAEATAELRWRSVSADLFRARCADLAGGLSRSAEGIERAAATLRGHARAVRRIEEIARAVERAGEQVANGVARAGRYVSGWL